MNERIRELTKQAGISILYEYDGYDGHAAVANLADIEKFAELIVKECAGLHTKNIMVGGGTDYNRGRRMLAEDILKHFGVE